MCWDGGVDVRLQHAEWSRGHNNDVTGIGVCARSNDIEATDVDYNRASAAQNVGVMPSRITRSEGHCNDGRCGPLDLQGLVQQ